jgi:hypothetical protein
MNNVVGIGEIKLSNEDEAEADASGASCAWGFTVPGHPINSASLRIPRTSWT